ncbi:MAG: hypothetical protein JO274_05870 [Gammaproteobacteria bacterium]|nr:hypothetical protein [Gammaproteobacteria bacterium]
MTEVEIKWLQSQQRPDADVYQADSGNHAMAYGHGLDPRTYRFLELGFQQQRGPAYERCSGNSSEPPHIAGSKLQH